MINTNVESMMKKLDDICFERVLERDGEECMICKLVWKVAISPLQPHHVWSRSFKNIRWDLRNIYPVCKNHHMFGIHSNKTLTEDIMRALIAVKHPERFEYITREKSTFFDVDMTNLLKIKRDLNSIEF